MHFVCAQLSSLLACWPHGLTHYLQVQTLFVLLASLITLQRSQTEVAQALCRDYSDDCPQMPTTVNEEWFVKVVVRVDFLIHLLHTLRSDVFVRAEVRDVNQLPSHDESF